MANSTSNVDQLPADSADKEAFINQLIDALSPSMLFGRRAFSSSLLTWGYYGGNFWVNGDVTQVGNGTVSLTASASNYIECDRTGTVFSNTSGFTAGRIPLYIVTTNTTTTTGWTDYRPWAGKADQFIMKPADISVTTADVTLSAIQARGQLLRFTGALTGNRAIIVPTGPIQRVLMLNDTTADFTLTAKTSGGTGPQLPRGRVVEVMLDSTNVVPMNPKEFNQVLAYAASTTPNPLLGESFNIGALTGNITINNPAVKHRGMRMKLTFLQDGTGGRTLSWGADFKKDAEPAAGTANQVGIWSFFSDGTYWIQDDSAIVWR